MAARGFTLIELTLVLLILAIAAAAVTLRVQEPMARAELSEAVDAIAEFDALTRRYAREHDRPVRLVIDVAAGEIYRTDEGGTERLGAALTLPSSFRMSRLRIGEKQIAAGSASISCSRRGLTPSYAILLEDQAGRRRWIVAAGLTGRIVRTDDDEEIRKTFEALRPRRDAG